MLFEDALTNGIMTIVTFKIIVTIDYVLALKLGPN